MFRKTDNYEEVIKRLGYKFKKRVLLEAAITRRSAINEGIQDQKIGDYQRLETLGDSILNMVITDILFEHYPHFNEGHLTIKRSNLVRNGGPLAKVAEKLKLGRLIIMNKSEERLGLRAHPKVLSDVMEAIIGAIWLDSNKNYPLIYSFIQTHWQPFGLLPERGYNDVNQIIFQDNVDLEKKVSNLRDTLKKTFVKKATLNQLLIDNIVNKSDKPILSVLLEANPTKEGKNTALICAVAFGYVEAVNLLLMNGVSANIIYDPSEEDQDHWLDQSDESGIQQTLSVLQLAILKGRDDIVLYLLQHNADPNWQDSVTIVNPEICKEHLKEAINNALEVALPEFSGLDMFWGSSNELSLDELIALKRKKEEQKHSQQEKRYKNKRTALHVEVSMPSPSLKVIRLLLEAKADPNLKDYQEYTVLDLFLRSHPEIELDEDEELGNIWKLLIKYDARFEKYRHKSREAPQDSVENRIFRV